MTPEETSAWAGSRVGKCGIRSSGGGPVHGPGMTFDAAAPMGQDVATSGSSATTRTPATPTAEIRAPPRNRLRWVFLVWLWRFQARDHPGGQVGESQGLPSSALAQIRERRAFFEAVPRRQHADGLPNPGLMRVVRPDDVCNVAFEFRSLRNLLLHPPRFSPWGSGCERSLRQRTDPSPTRFRPGSVAGARHRKSNSAHTDLPPPVRALTPQSRLSRFEDQPAMGPIGPPGVHRAHHRHDRTSVRGPGKGQSVLGHVTRRRDPSLAGPLWLAGVHLVTPLG